MECRGRCTSTCSADSDCRVPIGGSVLRACAAAPAPAPVGAASAAACGAAPGALPPPLLLVPRWAAGPSMRSAEGPLWVVLLRAVLGEGVSSSTVGGSLHLEVGKGASLHRGPQ